MTEIMEKVPIEIYKFEPLFGKDIKGKIKTWDLKVERYDNYSEIVTMYGYKRLIETRRQINVGKNLGKKNQTNHYTQALAEAKSKWTKKRDIEQFYTESDTIIKPMENVDLNKCEKTVILPMLAHDFKKHKNKVIYPCMVQSKLDGMRMIYNTTTGTVSTRQGKEYNIVKESGKLYQELQKLPKGLILDGELYTNKLNFEVLGVLRKTKKLTKEELVNLQKIEYHIYDIIDTKLTFEERNKIIQKLGLSRPYDETTKPLYEKLVYVDTYQVNNEEEIKEYHTKFLEGGFEGTMVRNKNSLYKTKQRSSDLLKYKDFEDDEFKIIDYTIEKDTSGTDSNLVVWVVAVPIQIVLDGHTSELKEDEIEMENGRPTFIKVKVRPSGNKDERKELYKKCVENFEQFKGRKLWTKYFEKTRDGSLRFPSTYRSTYSEYIRDEIL
jgi:ATP-dependent DNA ligase